MSSVQRQMDIRDARLAIVAAAIRTLERDCPGVTLQAWREPDVDATHLQLKGPDQTGGVLRVVKHRHSPTETACDIQEAAEELVDIARGAARKGPSVSPLVDVTSPWPLDPNAPRT